MEHGDFKFSIGDIVAIADIEEVIFRVIGISVQDYLNEGQETYRVHLYKCMNVDDEEDIEYIHEDELVLIQTAGTYELTQTPDPLKANKKTKKNSKTNSVKKQKKTHSDNVNELLDKLNDYTMLYESFGDTRFRTVINNTIKKLSELSANKEG
jgi:hypothetical protein